MTSRTSSNSGGGGRRRRSAAFTLIELILVMALLVIGFGITFPTLRGFFRGRALDSEARRLLSLTRYGQSRAVSEGLPIVLWLDAREGTYGLQAAPGYVEDDDRAQEFQLEERLDIEVSAPPALLRMGRGSTVLANKGTGRRSVMGLPAIRFLPDGFIGESSPEYVELREGDAQVVWLVQSTNRLTYELHNDPPVLQRR